MFLEKLTKKEKEKLADIAIATYNKSGYPTVPNYANVKIEEDEISINWTEDSFLCGNEMFCIDILDFGIFFGRLDGNEKTEKEVFKFLDKKFPKYSKCYYEALKNELDSDDDEAIKELNLKIRRFKRNFAEELAVE